MVSKEADQDTKPWERQRDSNGKLEPNRWFDRFTAYRLMGANRSLLGCVNQERVGKGRKRSDHAPGSWRRAFKKWRWDERANAWDEHKRQEAEAEWEARRQQVKRDEWESAGKLLERAEQMLKFPLAEISRVDKVDDQGKPVSISVMKPVRWSQRDVAHFLETVSKLRRLAAEMETEKRSLDLTVSGDDLDTAIAAELARLAGLSKEIVLGATEADADAAPAES